MKISIIIPARYGSTRLPAKPLQLVCGQSILQRVVAIAKAVARVVPEVSIVVATDDIQIAHHCDELRVEWILSPAELVSGTDRVAYTIAKIQNKPELILNLQGDAALTPPHILIAMIAEFKAKNCDVITPVTQLSWVQLDSLRCDKLITPFSGTTAVFAKDSGKAWWFSKNILPAIRNEDQMRIESYMSPVFRHIGLYGYTEAVLAAYADLSISEFESLEGLEQLRLLEHGYTICCVPVDFKNYANMSGIDSPADVIRAEKLILEYGELFDGVDL